MSAPRRPFGQAEARREALAHLDAGRLVVLPTDTVYGIAARPGKGAALLMQRFHPRDSGPPWRMLPLLIAETSMADAVARIAPDARRLMRRFWPGALTLLLPPSAVMRRWGQVIAVRQPAHEGLRDFLRAAGGWLVVWRAAHSGEPSATNAEDAARNVGDEVALILDDGPTTHGLRSTVVDATTSPLRLVQRGALPLSALRAVVESLRLP